MRIEELGPVGPKAGRDHRNGISGAASEMVGLARASLKATATFRLPVIPSCASAGVCACRGLRAWPQALCRRLGHGVGLPCPLRIASSCVSSRKPPLKVSLLTPGVARSAASFLEFHRILTNISPLNKGQDIMILGRDRRFRRTGRGRSRFCACDIGFLRRRDCLPSRMREAQVTDAYV